MPTDNELLQDIATSLRKLVKAERMKFADTDKPKLDE